MSYGAFIHAEVDERLRTEFGTTDRKRCALKFASDNFGDYPEQQVYSALLALRWPARPVTVAEVSRALRCVSVSERRAWLTARAAEMVA